MATGHGPPRWSGTGPVGFTLAMVSAAPVRPRLRWRPHPGAHPERTRVDVDGVVVDRERRRLAG